MATSATALVRIRSVNGVLTDVTACYSELTLTADPQVVDVTRSCNGGTRQAPTRYKVDWRLSAPLDSDDIGSLRLALVPGNIISFEVCENPGAAAPARIYSVVVETTVAPLEKTKRPSDVHRAVWSGTGGDYYPDQVGRAGFPAPFNAD